jgi:hypothetical protein
MCCIETCCIWTIWPWMRSVYLLLLLRPLRLFSWPRCDGACTIIESFWRRSERRWIF